jgi:hypothetical protein
MCLRPIQPEPTTVHTRCAPHRHRRGMTAVIAVIYLTLFSTLAIGFYTSTSMSVKVVSNDRDVTVALSAAESGMQFMKYQLSRVTIPPTHTDPAIVITDVEEDLEAHLSSSRDVGDLGMSRSGLVISVPSDAGASIPLDGVANGASFSATITALPNVDNKLAVTVTGRYGGATRTVVMDYDRQQIPTSIYTYAIASRGAIVLGKGNVTSVDPMNALTINAMSARESTHNAVTVSGGTLGGNLSVLMGSDVDFTKGSVGGYSTQAMVLANTSYLPDAPEFPIVDTSVFKTYATNTFVNGTKTQKNIRVPAGTNPKFNGGDTVNGILYVESPNTVTFNGNFNMNGIIVFESKAGANTLNFSGNMSQTTAPSGAEFENVRAASNISILAPTALVNMTGSTGSYLRGSVIVDRFTFNGAADIRIDRGTLMTLNEGMNSAIFSGSKSVKFTATGEDNAPTTGLSYSSFFAPQGSSYRELVQ